METKKLTAKQYLKLHPTKYVMVTYEFGDPIFIAPTQNLKVQVTNIKNEAEIWSELDNSPLKLDFYKSCTGFNRLQFEKTSTSI